jgi:hypothetical protein
LHHSRWSLQHHHNRLRWSLQHHHNPPTSISGQRAAAPSEALNSRSTH